jgi:bifunctional UDP-N-acetylglucosamine pyrophosphorylase/glucosamine-1-phosphate N-acetyltransferase
MIAVVVLAAGLGKRMKSDLPKVMHRAAGRTLLGHVLNAAAALDPSEIVVIAGPERHEAVVAEVRARAPAARIALQSERRGTGHAVGTAQPALAGFRGTILVLYGDVPLIEARTLKLLAAEVKAATPMAVLGFRPDEPKGYGRLIQDDAGRLVAIVEELDASPGQRRINLCNSGLAAIDSDHLWRLLPKLEPKNAQGELYFTDLVELLVKGGAAVATVECPAAEVMGVNDRAQLAKVEATLQQRYRDQAMRDGATLTAPETVFFSADTRVGRDVTIEPHVVFGAGVTIGDRVEILAFSHIEGASIEAGARIGPFARLRPGAEIGPDAHIGNYVEVKKAVIGKGAKINHLSYVGDARVGAKTNIGAGTITCNYDGFDKHLTDIGSDVFVGSNTALVAPVKVGDGANIAAGSVITRDIPGDALAITRAPLETRAGWAAKYRQFQSAKKAAKAKKA